MKILQVVKKHYEILGVRSSNLIVRKYRFNERIFLGFLLFGCVIISEFRYTFYVASGFMQCMEGIGVSTGCLIILVGFTAIVFRKTTLFENIDKLEKLINTSEIFSNHIFYRWARGMQFHSETEIIFLGSISISESKALFSKTCQRVEQLSETVFTWIMKIYLQCLILPKCIKSLFAYFITDSGNDSFQLSFPMW